jgi:hypothetical protein
MKQIIAKEIQGKIATQIAINMVGNPCQLSEDASAQVGWQLFDSVGGIVSFGNVDIFGESYTALSTGDYYTNVWNFICSSIEVVII